MTIFNSVTDANGYLIPNRVDSNFSFGTPSTITISLGVATINSQYHKIAGAGATTDTLNTISGGKVGQRVILTPASTGYVTTIAKMASAGNIEMAADVNLKLAYSNIELLCTSTGASGTQAWIMVAKST